MNSLRHVCRSLSPRYFSQKRVTFNQTAFRTDPKILRVKEYVLFIDAMLMQHRALIEYEVEYYPPVRLRA